MNAPEPMREAVLAAEVPLVVDLDGTLILTDLLLESSLRLAKQRPLELLRIPGWLLGGKAALKAELAQRVDCEASTLPYNQPLLDSLRQLKAQGRRLVLATASHQRYATAVADHLQLFDEVLASTERHNLSGKAKRDALVQRFGLGGFDYAGNSLDDLPIWRTCRQGLVVNPAPGVRSQTRPMEHLRAFVPTPVPLPVPASAATPARHPWLRALRLHQWVKNLLIFVPLLSSHQFSQPGQVLRGLLAFGVFGLCASSVYLLNDLLDLQDDRHHPLKRLRPFAHGDLPLLHGLLLAPLLLVTAFGLALALLPTAFALGLAVYFGLTLAYSLALKQLVVVDVVVLALLYTLRIVAGTLAFSVPPTFWLLAFSMFIFFSLALVKRYAELHESRTHLLDGQARGRGYFADDLPMVAALGAASGFIAVLVLALYVQDRAIAALYTRPQLLWLVCPLLLFWISRTWLLTHRGQMHDDPVVFAIKDSVSLGIGALFLAIFWFAN